MDLQSTDAKFLQCIRLNNNGKLPDGLVDPDTGCLRQLTPAPEDRENVDIWTGIFRRTINRPSAPCPARAVGSPVQSCSPPPQPPPPKPCKHKGLTVKCGHASRNFQVKLDADGVAINRLQVKAGNTRGDEITCETQKVEGFCDAHRQGAISVFYAQPTSQSDTRVVFTALSHELSFLEWFWPANVHPQPYQVAVQTCHGKPIIAWIDAYPDLKWDVKLTAGFDTSAFFVDQIKLDPMVPTRRIAVPNRMLGEQLFAVDFSVKRTYNGQTYEIDPAQKLKLEKVLSIFNWVADKVMYFLPRLLDWTGTRFTLRSKVMISGSWGWDEIPGQWRCGFGGNVKLSLDPLLEISVKQDVTEAILAILSLAPIAPLRTVAQKLKEFRASMRVARREYFAQVPEHTNYGKAFVFGAIYLTVTGAIGIEWTWEKKPDQPKWNGVAKAGKTSIDFDLSSTLEGGAKGRIYCFEASASATLEGGVKSGCKAEAISVTERNNSLMLGCRLTFNGITFRGLAKADGNVKVYTGEEEEKKWEASPGVGLNHESTDGTITTRSGVTLKTGAGGTGAEYRPGSMNQETKARDSSGQEYTRKKTTTSGEATVGPKGAVVKASAAIEYTVWPPKTWNYTEQVDEKGNQPLGLIHLFDR